MNMSSEIARQPFETLESCSIRRRIELSKSGHCKTCFEAGDLFDMKELTDESIVLATVFFFECN